MSDPNANRCGSCGAFTPYGVHPELGPVGNCARSMISYPVPVTATCSEYRARGTGNDLHQRTAERTLRAKGARATPSAEKRQPLPTEVDLDMDMETFRAVLKEVLREELGVGEASLGARWQGGEIILKPGREGTAEKRIPMETFFHKIVMVRDKLRVLEQRVNAHAALTDEDKVAMQQYVTACYGSLTTFNVLFADGAVDGFRGAAGKE